MNIRLEDFETKIIEFNSQISDFKQTFDHHKEHIGKIDKNFEFLSMQMNTLIQKELCHAWQSVCSVMWFPTSGLFLG